MVLMNNLMSILLFVLGTLILGIVFSLFLLFYSLYDMFKSIFFGGSR